MKLLADTFPNSKKVRRATVLSTYIPNNKHKMEALTLQKKRDAHSALVAKEPGLKDIPLLTHLSGEELDYLEMNAVFKTFKKKQVIYHEGCRHSGIYYVLKGIVKIYKIGTNGKQQILCFSQKGDVIAYRSLLSHETACTSAKASEDTLICHVPYYVLMELLQKNWEFAHDMMKYMCRELPESNTFAIDIAQKTVKERTAEMLLILKDKFGVNRSGVLQITITREDLANMAGTVTESLIRTMSELKNEGLLDFVGRKIALLDVQRLKTIANS